MRAAILTGLALYVIGAVLVLSRWQWACAAALLAGLAAILAWEKNRREYFLRIMLVAGLLGSIGEWVCVHKFDLWRYHFPVFKWGLPVWIGFVWAYLFSVYILIAEPFASGWSRLPENLRRLLGVTFGVTFFLFLHEVFDRIGIYISYYYILFLGAGLVLWRTPLDIFTLIVAGLGGTFGEYLAIQNGLWHYTQPAFTGTGMPISLPLAWGLAGVYVRNAALRFWQSTLWLAAGGGVLYGVLRIL
ncbi:hypothetical protein HY522_06800 [bacterium]|nr:hypothetical protein [bacterium]